MQPTDLCPGGCGVGGLKRLHLADVLFSPNSATNKPRKFAGFTNNIVMAEKRISFLCFFASLKCQPLKYPLAVPVNVEFEIHRLCIC